jgi:DNA polymerase-3 subunit gamma/tau
VRYAPTTARYKVYIIDEVHMMTGSAFNAFLKTLEEPPPHAKFIFATTEIGKVPITVLSRCQRFDLRRVEAGVLVSHLQTICKAETIQAEDEALAAIARAAEGSVRDSLSILDQAIAHAAGTITLDNVRSMLGLADRARIIDLFEQVMRGDIAAALGELRAQYDAGADPAVVLSDLAEFTHLVTRLKLVPEALKDNSLNQAERVRGGDFAGRLSIRVLARTWQLLLKGLAEVRQADRPIMAAEMVLVRLAHAADLPTPDEALKALRDGGGLGSGGNGSGNGGQAPRPPSGGGNTALAARPVLASPAAGRRRLARGCRGARLAASRHHAEARSGTRCPAGALRAGPDRVLAGVGRAAHARDRPLAQAQGLDRPDLDGRRRQRRGRRHPSGAGGSGKRPARERRRLASRSQGGAGALSGRAHRRCPRSARRRGAGAGFGRG